MADENKPSVDETPISPSRPYPERKNSIEKHLTNRPSPDELKQSTFCGSLTRIPLQHFTKKSSYSKNIADTTV